MNEIEEDKIPWEEDIRLMFLSLKIAIVLSLSVLVINIIIMIFNKVM